MIWIVRLTGLIWVIGVVTMIAGPLLLFVPEISVDGVIVLPSPEHLAPFILALGGMVTIIAICLHFTFFYKLSKEDRKKYFLN